MPKSDTSLTNPTDLTRAFGLLTRLPFRPTPTDPTRTLAQSAWSWPLVGAVLGVLAGIAGLVVMWLGASSGIAAGTSLITLIMLTGALHEDGLADTADGLWGGNDKPRRLEIMKDSRVGSYGVIALSLSLIFRWSALAGLMQAGWFFMPIIATALLSRVPMVVLMAALPNARGTGLSAHSGKPKRQTVLLALAIALLGSLFLIGYATIVAAFWLALATIAVAALAKEKIDGQTGDILGASQQIGEVAILASLAALVT